MARPQHLLHWRGARLSRDTGFGERAVAGRTLMIGRHSGAIHSFPELLAGARLRLGHEPQHAGN